MNKNIFSEKRKFFIHFSAYIFILALGIRVILINTVNHEYIAPDGIGYYILAHNLYKGNGLVFQEGEKSFFREPGYPVFLSASFYITQFISKVEGQLIYDDNSKILNRVPELLVAKYLQAILDSFSCVLFFLIISGIIKQKYAIIISIAFCLYYPYAMHSAEILRETLQSFLLLCMSLSFLQYFYHNKWIYLIFTGFFWGLANLTFQATIIFAVSIPIFIWIYNKSFTKSIIPSTLIALSMLITVSPWLFRSYNQYSDWRILKSFGTSFTPELRKYSSSLFKAEYYGLMNHEQLKQTLEKEWYGLSDDEKFKLSWNGTITKKADSINALIKEPTISKRKIKNLGVYFYKSWFPTKYPNISTKELISQKPLLAIFFIFPVIIISVLAFVGIQKFYPKYFIINIVFTTFISIFFIISTEYRRMLPALPYIFLYGMSGLIFLYEKYINKLNRQDIFAKILK